jgi:hypothetical protein
VYKKTQIGRLRGKVGIAVVDEAHRLKDKSTVHWKAFDELQADHVYVLGATPMANVGSPMMLGVRGISNCRWLGVDCCFFATKSTEMHWWLRWTLQMGIKSSPVRREQGASVNPHI